MAKGKKTFDIYMNHEYGPYEVYSIQATSLKEAKEKAKKKYMKTYFKKSLIKASKAF